MSFASWWPASAATVAALASPPNPTVAPANNPENPSPAAGRASSSVASRLTFSWISVAFGNLLGPIILGGLFDSVGRRPMIAGTYVLSGCCCWSPATRSSSTS